MSSPGVAARGAQTSASRILREPVPDTVSTLHIVVMGPSGSGKSVIGALLAQRLAMPFVDGDDLHPSANVAKMTAGTPLDDGDRMPWLDRVGSALTLQPSGVVIACSALARRYRDRIRAHAPGAVFVELLATNEELARRMETRDHFMPPALLASQVEALEHLEADEVGVSVITESTPDCVAGRAYEFITRSYLPRVH